MSHRRKDSFEPQEKCVDVSLATSMLYFAAIPYAYDIAIAVVGDIDFKPVLQHVRRLGKRVAIASKKGSCPPDFYDPSDEARVKDFDIIWLDDLLHKLELKYERHQLQCESPFHTGKKEAWTKFHPRKGQPFYCDVCREEFKKQKQDIQREFVSSQIEAEDEGVSAVSSRIGVVLTGVVKKKIVDRGFGFIQAWDRRDYYFHLTDLHPSLDFNDVIEGLEVDFEVKRQPSGDKTGAAQNVCRHAAQA